MVVNSRILAPVAVLLFFATACSSSSAPKKDEPPTCSDTSASASRLSHGCKLGDKTYKAIVTHCTDGRTMYNVPAAPPHGASGFSDGKIRTHAVSVAELSQCQSGMAPSSSP